MQIKVLGCIRYCKEWLKHVENYTPKLIKRNKEKIKIVFFLKKFQHNVFKSEVYRTLEIFALFPDIDFYIKPHTRDMAFPSNLKVENIHIDTESSSSSLINMADVIFFYGGTSIVLEAISKKKFTVCLDYLDSNKNIYEYFEACNIFRCRDDLCLFLESDIKKKIEKKKFLEKRF